MNPQLHDQFITDFHLEHLNPEDQQAAIVQVYDAFEARLSRVLDERLSDEQIEVFATVSEKGDEQAVVAWLQQQIPGYDDLIDSEYEAFTREYNSIRSA